jgi:hypothetical protein
MVMVSRFLKVVARPGHPAPGVGFVSEYSRICYFQKIIYTNSEIIDASLYF